MFFLIQIKWLSIIGFIFDITKSAADNVCWCGDGSLFSFGKASYSTCLV